jgi:NAD(P)-dependent dehydrogenase (short-subunit alcohol dehydrogenase family)
MRGLAGKAIVVTGAGAGIGRAVAVQVASAGGRVVVNDVQRPRVDDVVGGIRAAGGVAVPDYGSVSEWGNGTALIDKCVSQFGRIDGLVNNAAIHPVRDPWNETYESIREVVGVNLLGAVGCATSAMTIMRAQGSGSIVNLGSKGEVGLPGVAGYIATKAALTALTYSWAMDLSPYGVRVNAVWPWAKTEMTSYPGRLPAPDPPPPEANCPLILYLLSDLSLRTTGRLLSIRGSQLASIERPCSWSEPLRDDHWTVEKVAAAMENELASPGLPFNSYPSDCYRGPQPR